MRTRPPKDPGWGDVVRRLREARGWTQGDLAYHARIGQSQISRIESGAQAGAHRSTIVALCRALGVSPNVLLGWDEATGRPADPLTLAATNALRALLDREIERAGHRGAGQAVDATPNTDENYEACPALVEAALRPALAS